MLRYAKLSYHDGKITLNQSSSDYKTWFKLLSFERHKVDLIAKMKQKNNSNKKITVAKIRNFKNKQLQIFTLHM